MEAIRNGLGCCGTGANNGGGAVEGRSAAVGNKADRVGLASSLYLIGRRKFTTKKACKQLSLKHLHIKYAKTGILDYFFETAIKNGKNSPTEFIDWVKNEYNQQELKIIKMLCRNYLKMEELIGAMRHKKNYP